MEIKIEYVQEFLQKFGINWSGFSCKPCDIVKTFNEYCLTKATSFKKNICCENNGLNYAVLLYMGKTEPDCERIFVKRYDKNLAIFEITDYKFVFIAEEPNPEPCIFGDVDYEPYVWVEKKDLSKQWMQFLLTKNPEYGNYILNKFKNEKNNILKQLDYKTKIINQHITALNDQKAEAKIEAISQLNLVSKMESFVKSLQQEAEK